MDWYILNDTMHCASSSKLGQHHKCVCVPNHFLDDIMQDSFQTLNYK